MSFEADRVWNINNSKRWTVFLLVLGLLIGAATLAWIRYRTATPSVAAVNGIRMGSVASAGGALGTNPHAPILNQLAESGELSSAGRKKATDGGQTVSGTVSLAAALTAEVGPEDTVFVFARPAEGSRMPLAMLRKQVKDLPFQFVLDDSTAMSPATRLSQAGRVVVGARVTRSPNAAPLKGDPAGHSAPVAVGSERVTIEINEIVKE